MHRDADLCGAQGARGLTAPQRAECGRAFGLLQPFADGLKLLVKETIVPSGANPVVFIIAPLVTFTLALVAWAVIPSMPEW